MSGRIAVEGPWIPRSTWTGGVGADAVDDVVGARGAAGAEEVLGAACHGAAAGTDDGEGVAEDVADVEIAARVRLDDGALGVDEAVGVLVCDADLAGEAGAEVGAAGRGTGVGAVVEGEPGVFGVAGPDD